MTPLLLTPLLSSKFITDVCPWIDDWDPQILGYIFILGDEDIGNVDSVCIVPHIPDGQDDSYKESMTIDLKTFDLWETPAIYFEIGYWNVVAVFGQDYGCTVFLADGFVSLIPELEERLEDIRQR